MLLSEGFPYICPYSNELVAAGGIGHSRATTVGERFTGGQSGSVRGSASGELVGPLSGLEPRTKGAPVSRRVRNEASSWPVGTRFCHLTSRDNFVKQLYSTQHARVESPTGDLLKEGEIWQSKNPDAPM